MLTSLVGPVLGSVRSVTRVHAVLIVGEGRPRTARTRHSVARLRRRRVASHGRCTPVERHASTRPLSQSKHNLQQELRMNKMLDVKSNTLAVTYLHVWPWIEGTTSRLLSVGRYPSVTCCTGRRPTVTVVRLVRRRWRLVGATAGRRSVVTGFLLWAEARKWHDVDRPDVGKWRPHTAILM